MVTIERDARRIEQLLSVSLIVLFHPDPLRKDSRRYQSVIRGWRWGEYVMMDRPRVDARSLLMIREGQDCNVRYMIDGKACGFESRVLDFDTARNNPYMRLKWPEQLEYTYFRRGERIKSNLPCTVSVEGDGVASGTVVDMSQGGIAIELPSTVEKGKRLFATFELPGGQKIERLPVLVCNVREQGRLYFHGCAFEDTVHPSKEDIAFFVVSRLAAERGSAVGTALRRTLIIDHNMDRTVSIVKNLARKGIECVTANNAVDGFHRLKSLPHAGVAIAFSQPDLVGGEISRVIRASGDFPHLPIVVYGGTDADAAAVVRHAGATLGLPDSPAIGPDVALALSKLILPAR